MADKSPAPIVASLTEPQNVQGMIWMVLAGAVFSLTFTVIRILGDSLSVFELVFLRNLFGFLVFIPFLMRAGTENLRPVKPLLLSARAVAQVAALSTWYFGLLVTPLAAATALGLVEPIFMALLAVWVLKEKSSPARWLAVIAGFAGSLIIIRPGFTDISLGGLSVILSALFWAIFVLLGKMLTRHSSALVVTAYPTALVVPIALIPALFDWQWPTPPQWGLLVLAGGLSSFANWCLARAFQVGEVTAVSPIAFTRLIFSALLGFFIFAEVPELWVWVGGALIVAAGTYLARIEARDAALRKEARQAVNGET